MPAEIPAEAIAAAHAYDAAHRNDPGQPQRTSWARPPDEQVARLLAGAAPVLAAAVRKDQDARRLLSAVFACRSEDCPQPFALHRDYDVTGVSGRGTVAHGVQFADGTVVLRWADDKASTVIWDSLDNAMEVHGHDGKTRVVWLAAPFSEMGLAEREAAAAERARVIRHLESVAVGFETSHKPASDTCAHAEGIRYAIGCLELTGGDDA